MKNPLPKLLATLALAAIGAAPVAAQTQPAAPIAPAGLEIQISTTQAKDGKNYLNIGPGHWYLNVVFRNISNKPIELIEETNSWGINNFHLEITAVDGKTLTTPLQVSRSGFQFMISSWLSTQTLEPNQSIVREVRFQVPAEIKRPYISPVKPDDYKDNSQWNYLLFPFRRNFPDQSVMMKAVYEVPKRDTPNAVWRGHVESPLLTYELRDSKWGNGSAF